MPNYYILTINPGSTSLKFALFLNEKIIYQVSINHNENDLIKLKTIAEHCQFRKNLIVNFLNQNKFNLKKITIIMARGGLLSPIAGGTYLINEKMIDDLKNSNYGFHASNFAAIIANELAIELSILAYINNPVVVDEMVEIAKITGLKGIKKKSIFHALNHKSVGIQVAKQLNKNYNNLNLIIAHLGGGISIGAHYQGKVVDVNNALNGEGPFSPTRVGTLPMIDLLNLSYSQEYSQEQLEKLLFTNGGFYSYFKTNNLKQLEEELETNDEIKIIFDAMIYQIAKTITSYTAILKGKVDAIVLTGGIAYSKYIIKKIKSYISWISKVIIIAGENELLALANAGIRLLNQEEIILAY